MVWGLVRRAVLGEPVNTFKNRSSWSLMRTMDRCFRY